MTAFWGDGLVALFFEALTKHARAIAASELFSPRDERTITDHFIMFDRLRGSYKRSVEDLRVIDLAGNFIGFFYDELEDNTFV